MVKISLQKLKPNKDSLHVHVLLIGGDDECVGVLDAIESDGHGCTEVLLPLALAPSLPLTLMA